MRPSAAAFRRLSLLSFFRNGDLPTVARSYHSEVKNRDLAGLPPSKFATIPKIPAKLKEIFADRMESLLKSGFDSAVSLVTNQEALKKYAKILIQTVNEGAKKGDDDSIVMKRVYEKFAQGSITHFHLTDSFEKVIFDEKINFNPESYQEFEDRSPLNRDFFEKVGIDNKITSPADSAQKILEELTNIGFSFTSLLAMGCGYPNQKEKPIFCFRTTHPQYPHVDSINSAQSIALALYAINADGMVKTYVADIEKILYFLTTEEIDLLRQKVFYIPSDDDSDYDNKKDLFSILEFKSNGEPFVRFEGKPDAIKIDNYVDELTANKMIKVIDKINDVVGLLLEVGKIESIGLKTGEFLFSRNRLVLHGRQDEQNKFGDGETFLSSPSLLTSAGAQRRVSRMLSGAPSTKGVAATQLNSAQTESQI